MHVMLIIEGTYPWYRGGVSEWVYQYLSHLSDTTFTLIQIATDEFQGLDPNEALYPVTPNIQEFLRISPPEFSEASFNGLDSWYEEFIQTMSIDSASYDLIHVANTGFAGWLGAKLSEVLEIPMLLTEHAIYWKEVQMGASALECGYKIPTNEIKKQETVGWFKELARFTYQHADQVISVSEVNISEQLKLGAKNVAYIPNGIPVSFLVSEKSRRKVPHIGWVGRCAEMKNPLSFFDYVSAFRELDIDPIFTMLLSDANEKDLKHRVIETAKAFPEVTLVWNKSARSYFPEFDFLLITSHNESQPLVMLEALASKALPAGYQVGDFDQKFGLSFSKTTTISYHVDEITRLWNSTNEFKKTIESKFNLVRDNHTWSKLFDEYQELMSSLAAHKNTVRN